MLDHHMLVAVLIALLGLATVAASARPTDGRAETAIAVPLVAVVAVIVPAVAVVALAGAALAYVVATVLARRTLWRDRRLRAVAAGVGATVPLAAVVVGAVTGAPPVRPELWIVGAIVPGALADDVRRQLAERRGAIAFGGAATLLGLVLSGLVLSGSLAGVDLGALHAASTGDATAGSLAGLAVVLLAALAAGTLARWRYGLHVAPISVPLLAVWSLEGIAVPLTYLLAILASTLAIAALQPRLRLPGRKLATSLGVLGAAVGGITILLGAPGLPALLAGTLAAEDARLLGRHAGADLLDGVALAASIYVLALVTLVVPGGLPSALPGLLGGLAAGLAVVTASLVVARRERERPSELRLRAAEWRWAP